ncbi:MAG: hypothetical protein QNJ58_26015, partial [Desulfobacterales bacterium]|nr:hypothetical protein [Desulfobacterales bacterium]
MKIRNHFVVKRVYRYWSHKRQLIEFNSILPEGLLFFTFCHPCRGILSGRSFNEDRSFSDVWSAESEKKNQLCVLGASSAAGG